MFGVNILKNRNTSLFKNNNKRAKSELCNDPASLHPERGQSHTHSVFLHKLLPPQLLCTNTGPKAGPQYHPELLLFPNSHRPWLTKSDWSCPSLSQAHHSADALAGQWSVLSLPALPSHLSSPPPSLGHRCACSDSCRVLPSVPLHTSHLTLKSLGEEEGI